MRNAMRTTVLIGLFLTVLQAANAAVPSGFYLVRSSDGISLYRKDYVGGQPDYVQIIDLSLGAAVDFRNGPIVDPGYNEGVYGGDDPTVERQSLQTAWSEFAADESREFSITNGQFFRTTDDPTNLAFPVKAAGFPVSDGYGIDEYQNQKLMLEVWGDRTDIRTFQPSFLSLSSAPNIIVGLTEDADKDVWTYTGRTFVGVDDDDGDGRYEIVLIFNSKYARQPDAAAVLRTFGADKVMMLDGGGSTQMICQGTTYVSSSREIPQTLATLSSPADAAGRSCGSGLIYDCALNCVNQSTLFAWIGDGYCDDGTWVIDLLCSAFMYDDGDCASSAIPADSCGSNLVIDCDFDCVNATTAWAWIGDGCCDDGTYGMNLVCAAFQYDRGDCN